MDQKLRMALGWTTMAVVLTCAVAVMLPGVSSTRYVVGAKMGWTSNVNYTVWARTKHFYRGDWLYFVYDRNRMNVLEVNKKDYKSCNSKHPLHNWTKGYGRDVVPLNVTKTYYFISAKAKGFFCHRGTKVAIRVN
ncbi:PREDICTED: lamin-like protein [Ipomoea nil]|uniref:lamin-like protein n=1 Tax=Ipomoea nil TaxID=35883 RepID=UPI000900DA3F|nr:PREDICTED: lamin-like protein [Ipomoea nil]